MCKLRKDIAVCELLYIWAVRIYTKLGGGVYVHNRALHNNFGGVYKARRRNNLGGILNPPKLLRRLAL